MSKITRMILEEWVKHLSKKENEVEKELGVVAYSMFDKKNNSWGIPVFFKTPVDMTRNIEAEAKNPKSLLGNYAADFALYDVGFFDQRKGVFTPNEKPQFVAEGVEFVKKEGV